MDEGFYYTKKSNIVKKEDIKSIHNVNGKTIIVLKSVEPSFKPKKKKIKAKNYFSKLKNSK